MNFAAYFVPLSRTGSHQPQKRVSAFEGFYGLYSTMRGSTRPLTIRHCVVGKKASLNVHTQRPCLAEALPPLLLHRSGAPLYKVLKSSIKVQFGREVTKRLKSTFIISM